MAYYVYAIYSPSLNKIYIGQTNNLNQRLHAHKRGYSKYTSIASDWKLFYKEECADRSSAVKRERQLKTSRGRAFLREFFAPFSG